METIKVKNKIVKLLKPYYDIFKSCEIAHEIIRLHKDTGQHLFKVKVTPFYNLEINLRGE